MDAFWKKADRTGESCWTWRGSIDAEGYGRYGAKSVRAHRIAYELTNGQLPAGACVLHSCDNPPCVNPAHLRAGSRKENADDREARRRHPHVRGAANGRAKLTTRNVGLVKRRAARGESLDAIAERYGVSRGAVDGIVTGKTWRHLLPSD